MKHIGSTQSPRSLTPVFAAALLGVLFTFLLPMASAQAGAYRYWGYYVWQHGHWQFATKGPDQLTPADGSVQGWRFAVADVNDTRTPRGTISFTQVCAATKAAAGHKRVAVVLDYGRPADSADGATPPAPIARCASVSTGATGLDVLGAVAAVRTDKSLVCAVDSYPASGCGDAVKTVTAAAKLADTPIHLAVPSSTASSSGGSPGTGTWIGIGVVAAAALGLGGTVLLRRRES